MGSAGHGPDDEGGQGVVEPRHVARAAHPRRAGREHDDTLHSGDGEGVNTDDEEIVGVGDVVPPIGEADGKLRAEEQPAENPHHESLGEPEEDKGSGLDAVVGRRGGENGRGRARSTGLGSRFRHGFQRITPG